MPYPNTPSMESMELRKKEGKEAEEKAANFIPPSSSPSHEFSFEISLHPPPLRTLKSPASLAIDLAPADDIFFHGHLLPLRLLSHPTPISPRTSNVSLENSRVPSRDPKNCTTTTITTAGGEGKERNKTTKTLTSLLSGIRRWRKTVEAGEMGEDEEEGEEDKTPKKKRNNKRFDFARFLRKYASVLEVKFSFFKGGAGKGEREKRPYSFSGSSNLNVKGRQDWRRKRRGEFSAPASMWTSPTNSGYLLAAGTNFSSSDESTMEELQSAIQAAILHCKNSIAIKQEETCPC